MHELKIIQLFVFENYNFSASILVGCVAMWIDDKRYSTGNCFEGIISAGSENDLFVEPQLFFSDEKT